MPAASHSDGVACSAASPPAAPAAVVAGKPGASRTKGVARGGGDMPAASHSDGVACSAALPPAAPAAVVAGKADASRTNGVARGGGDKPAASHNGSVRARAVCQCNRVRLTRRTIPRARFKSHARYHGGNPHVHLIANRSIAQAARSPCRSRRLCFEGDE